MKAFRSSELQRIKSHSYSFYAKAFAVWNNNLRELTEIDTVEKAEESFQRVVEIADFRYQDNLKLLGFYNGVEVTYSVNKNRDIELTEAYDSRHHLRFQVLNNIPIRISKTKDKKSSIHEISRLGDFGWLYTQNFGILPPVVLNQNGAFRSFGDG